MAASVSITIYPSDLGAEYLSVSDALSQVLDIVEALDASGKDETTNVVWRLTEAHTSSPPLSVTIEAFSVDPTVSVALEGVRIVRDAASGIAELLSGKTPNRLQPEVAAPLKKVMKRNLNGIGRTVIFSDVIPDGLDIIPSVAKIALAALERFYIDTEAALPDLRRTEYGSLEVEVNGVSRWYEKPALIVIERLSRDRVFCVLSPELVSRLGPTHQWADAWQDERIVVSGALHFDSAGRLKRIRRRRCTRIAVD